MKQFIYITSLITIILFASLACSGKESKSTENKDSTQTVKVQYTCSMHPEIVQDNPGKCPKCGMDLVEKK